MGKKICRAEHRDNTGQVDGVCTLGQGHRPSDVHHAYDARTDIRWTERGTKPPITCGKCGRIGQRGFTYDAERRAYCTAKRACRKRCRIPLYRLQR